MKKIFTLVSTIFMLVSLQAQTIKELWANCYKDSTIGQSFPNDMITDVNGNTYITGYFEEPYPNFYNKHYFLIKNNSAGIQQWVRAFPVLNDPSDSTNYDLGKSLAIDKKGNIYVTGERYDTVCNICTINTKYKDLFTIKYDAAGNLVWLNRYNGLNNTYQESADITIDSKGLIYVVANEKKYNASTFTYDVKMMVQKINKTGGTVWVKKQETSIGNAITTDLDNNVLVAGSFNAQNLYQLQKPLLAKYNSMGDSLWTKVFSEPNKNGRALFVACDSFGNVYVNGSTDTITFYNNQRIITIKYSSTGNLIWWKKEADHTYTLPNIFGGFAIDQKGNAYVTGYVSLSNINDNWVVSKYNKNGNQLWSTQYDDGYNFRDQPAGLQVDAVGNVYVTGNSANQHFDYQYATVKYNDLGVQQWVKTYRYPVAHSNNFPVGLGLDTLGNVYVSGNSAGGVCTVKYGKISTLSAIKQSKIPVNSISLYPNPCKNNLWVAISESNNNACNYKIYNYAGLEVLSGILQKNLSKSPSMVNVQSLPKGMYLLKVNDGINIFSSKFLKE